jgi:serine phosphatase RsbU (regulator of sigma subunit)
MGQLRIALRVYALEHGAPGTALERLDQFVLTTGATPMATVLAAVFEPELGVLRLASAGHPPPVLIDATGRAQLVDVKPAPPVGVGLLSPGRVSEREIPLSPGDTVLLYTDGLVERRDEILDAGIGRLLAESAAAADLDVAALARHLMDRLVDDTDRRDDTAVLAFRIDG